MRPRFLIALCALLLVALHAPARPAPADAAPRLAASITASYSGPTTDRRAQLVHAIEQGQREQLAEFYAWQVAHPPAPPAPPQRRVSSTTSTSTGSHRGWATAKECVSMTENGGDYGRSSNVEHFGRYQFARQSWASFGGDPDTWGTASPAEQDEVFERAWSQGEAVQRQQWLRWDGCG